MSDNDNSNVVVLQVDSTLDLPLERVLDEARAAELEDAMIVGWDHGKKFYLSSQTCDAGKMLILLERARALVVRRLEGNDE